MNENKEICGSYGLTSEITNPSKEQQEFYSKKVPSKNKTKFYKVLKDGILKIYDSIFDINPGDIFVSSRKFGDRYTKMESLEKAYINKYGLPVIKAKLITKEK